MVYCVGLTGGIGCGKTTVAQLFSDHGVAIIDTDVIAHALTQPGTAGLHEIARQFGAGFFLPNGTLDRAKLRTQIFSDPAAKSKLEAILHPLIYAQVLSTLNACHAPYAIIVVPLLFETRNYLPLIQRSLVVDCSEADQVTRTTARSPLSAQAVQAIMAQQLPRRERLQQADEAIRNEHELEALRAQVAALHLAYLARAHAFAAKP